MSSNRVGLTARVVPLGSAEAGDRRMGGTAAERVASVGALTRLAWQLAGRAFPAYTRATTPVVRTTLLEQTDALSTR